MEKRNKLMEQCRKSISPEVKEMVNLSVQMADKIFDILEEKNMTQREFAKLLGKKESEISKWLTGTHNFTLGTIAKIQAVVNDSIIEIPRRKIQNNKSVPFGMKVPLKNERSFGVTYATSTMKIGFLSIVKELN